MPIVGTSPGGDPPRRGPRRVRPGARRGRPARAQARHGHVLRRGQGDRRRDRLPGAGPAVATCSAAAAWRSSTTRPRLAAYIDRATEITPDHPVLVDRFLDDAVEIDVDALYDGTELYLGGVMEHIEEAGIHSGDSACALPPITLGGDDIERIRALHRGDRRGRRRARAAQHPVRAGRRRALRAGGQPARLAHGAVRLQGDRGAAGQGRRPDHARRDRSPSCGPRACCRPTGDGGDLPPDAPIAVKEAVLPFNRFRTSTARRRHRARPGDALHRRGHGHRRRLRHGVRQVAGRRPTARCRPRAACSSRSPTATSGSMIFPVKRLADLGFEILATAGTAEVLRRNGVARDRRAQAQRGPGPGRRADHRAADPGRRGRPDRQHAVRRLGGRRARRLRDPHRGGGARHPVHHHRAGRWPRRCRASRR